MNTETPSGRSNGDESVGPLLSTLGDHYFWMPRLLWRAGVWSWIVPWPLLILIPKSRRQPKEHGSVWLSLVIGIAVFLGFDGLAEFGASHAGDLSRALFTGSFLVMTMLSVSVATPGQAILRLVLGKSPLFAVEFVSPTLWAFLWGIAAGICTMLYADFCHAFQSILSAVALYALSMEVNAVLYTIRMYTLGLVLAAQEASNGGQTKKP